MVESGVVAERRDGLPVWRGWVVAAGDVQLGVVAGVCRGECSFEEQTERACPARINRPWGLGVWLQQRQVPWQSTAIGLSTETYNNFKTASGAAQTAWTAYQNAKQALTDASDEWKRRKKDARTAASAGVKSIRTFAEQQPNPQTIFGLAQIPAPKVPNFGVPPGQPGSPRIELDAATGALDIRFECNNPPGLSGTVYIVARRSVSTTGTFGPWQQVAVTSVKRFLDASLVAGTPAVQYQITAQRGSVAGTPSLPILVSFGRSGGAGNGPGLTVTEGEFVPTPTKSPKLAA